MQVIGNPNEALTARGGLVDDSYYAYTMFRENKGKQTKGTKGTPQNTKGKKKKGLKAQSNDWGD